MLEPEDKKVLADLKEVIDSLELPMLIVGAGARLLVFDKQQNIQGRSTRDWDIAIPVTDWSDFQTVRDRMTQGVPPRFNATRITHKFIHIETNTEVDIVPFGAIGEPNQQIEWSDGNQMNVMGLEEALHSASTELIDDLEFQVVDTPAFVVLKLFAWSDRREKTTKDLSDIEFILKHYSDDERVYEELVEELSTGELEYQDAAIYLLGQDIRSIFRAETVHQIDLIVAQLLLKLDDASDFLAEKLQVLRQGLHK
ncbi:MAG: nucleotidyl transferase AbiEii/AbiGii toxin family protein [Myxacorys chilensis ATA2-1-KO14]|jgi:predicted nucleotidyltransferase|nr:nucleotidyl transferase AbiEii/AbiGii toxin family protein [Myxacorys chilensis ATA2-1-KO14]